MDNYSAMYACYYKQRELAILNEVAKIIGRRIVTEEEYNKIVDDVRKNN